MAMNGLLSSSIALGRPDETLDRIVDAVRDVRAGRIPVEIRLGVGPLRDERLPARVLGHAKCIAETIGGDLASMFGRQSQVRIAIFSSAPKAGTFNPRTDLRAVVALACALRTVGIDHPVQLDLAASHREVPSELDPPAHPELISWFNRAAAKSESPIAPMVYAIEHAAASMFGDLADRAIPPVFRVTIGSTPEGRFWEVRRLVRQAAIAAGIPVVPALALIMKSCRIPWYHATPEEPDLHELTVPVAAIRRLENAANPTRGGNTGLSKEARAMRAACKSASVSRFLEDVDAVALNPNYAHALGFSLGPTFNLAIRGATT